MTLPARLHESCQALEESHILLILQVVQHFLQADTYLFRVVQRVYKNNSTSIHNTHKFFIYLFIFLSPYLLYCGISTVQYGNAQLERRRHHWPHLTCTVKQSEQSHTPSHWRNITDKTLTVKCILKKVGLPGEATGKCLLSEDREHESWWCHSQPWPGWESKTGSVEGGVAYFIFPVNYSNTSQSCASVSSCMRKGRIAPSSEWVTSHRCCRLAAVLSELSCDRKESPGKWELEMSKLERK